MTLRRHAGAAGSLRRPLQVAGSLLALALAAVAFAACGSSSSSGGATTSASGGSSKSGAPVSITTGKPISVKFVGYSVTDPFWGSLKLGVDAAAKATGANVDYLIVTDPKDFGAPSYARLIQQAIAQKPDGLVVANFFPDAVHSILKQATAGGLPLFEVNSGETSWRPDGALGYVGETDISFGEGGGQQLLAAGAKHVLCVMGAGNTSLERRCSGVANAMRAGGGTLKDLIINPNDYENPTTLQQQVIAAVRSGDNVDGLWVQGTAQSMQVLQGLKQAGLMSKVKLASSDISTDIVKAIQRGDIVGALDQQPYLEGYYAALEAVQYAQWKVHPIGAVATGPLKIDPSDAANYLRIVQDANGVRGQTATGRPSAGLSVA